MRKIIFLSWAPHSCDKFMRKKSFSFQFLSAFFLLMCGVLLAACLCSLEHFYFRYIRCSLLAIRCSRLVIIRCRLLVITKNPACFEQFVQKRQPIEWPQLLAGQITLPWQFATERICYQVLKGFVAKFQKHLLPRAFVVFQSICCRILAPIQLLLCRLSNVTKSRQDPHCNQNNQMSTVVLDVL